MRNCVDTSMTKAAFTGLGIAMSLLTATKTTKTP